MVLILGQQILGSQLFNIVQFLKKRQVVQGIRVCRTLRFILIVLTSIVTIKLEFKLRMVVSHIS